jgi:hypothetical protein
MQGLSTVSDSNSETDVYYNWIIDCGLESIDFVRYTVLMQMYMYYAFKTFLYCRPMHHFVREPFLYIFTFKLS